MPFEASGLYGGKNHTVIKGKYTENICRYHVCMWSGWQYGKERICKSEKGKNKSKASATPTLDQFSRDMTMDARMGNLDPVIGREKEIERVLQILSRRMKNNPCMVGEPGVGKTAVAEGIAYLIAAGDVPDTVRDKRLLSLDLSSMVAGSKYRGEFEERIKKVIAEVKMPETSFCLWMSFIRSSEPVEQREQSMHLIS